MLVAVLLAAFAALYSSAPLSCFHENGTIQLNDDCSDVVAVFGTVHPFQTAFNISASESEVADEKAVLQIGIGSWTKNLTIWHNSSIGRTLWTFDGKEAKSRDGGLPLAASLQFNAIDGRNISENVARFSIKDAESQLRAALIKRSDGVKLMFTEEDKRIERLPIWFRVMSSHQTIQVEPVSKSKIMVVCPTDTSTDNCLATVAYRQEFGAHFAAPAPEEHVGPQPDIDEVPHPAAPKTWLEDILDSPLYVVLFVIAILLILVCYSSSLCMCSVMTAGLASILTQDENTQMPRSQAISRSITRTFRISRSKRSPMPPLPPVTRLPSTTTSNLIAATSSNPTYDDAPFKAAALTQSKRSTRKSRRSHASKRSARKSKGKSARAGKPDETSSSTFPPQKPASLPLMTPDQHTPKDEVLYTENKAFGQ